MLDEILVAWISNFGRNRVISKCYFVLQDYKFAKSKFRLA